jgi:type I restriction enzyme S subunit
MSDRIAPWLANSRWPTVPIRYVARLGTGHTPSRQHPEYWENCTVPWVTLADVWQLRSGTADVIHETKEKISPLGIANSSAVKHPAGTVILSRTASVGFSAILGEDMATSQDFATWTCGEKLDHRYLLYALRAMAPDLRRVAAGSTHKTIYMPDIEQLRVPLPSLIEQRSIADFLDSETGRIESLIALRTRQGEILTENLSAKLSRWAEALVEQWGATKLRYILRGMEQGWSPECEDRPASHPEWGVIKAGCVNGGIFRAEQHKALPTHLAPKQKYQLREGDLLMSRASGSVEHIGSVGVVPHLRQKLLLCDKIYRLHVDKKRVTTSFLAHMLRTQDIREQIKMGISGAGGLANNLPSPVVRDLRIPVPPLDVQDQTVTQIQDMSTKIGALQNSTMRQVRVMLERRQALITAAVTGQIDVTTARGASQVPAPRTSANEGDVSGAFSAARGDS